MDKEIIIRPIKQTDSEGVSNLRLLKGVIENTAGLPSNRIKRTADSIENLDPDSHVFVAVVKSDNEPDLIVGWAGLFVNSNPRLRHSAGIGLMVHTNYQHQKIGTNLMESLIDLADNWLMLTRLELDVFSDNEVAIKLYKKFGFEKEGVKRLASIRNGKLDNLDLMARIKN